MKVFPAGRILMASILLNAAADSALAACEAAALQEPSVRSTVIAQGLVYPWNLAFLPTGDMLVTERPGRLRVVRNGVLLDEPIHGLPRLVNLFDVAVHPDFANNRLLFLAYFARDASAVGLEVLRARLTEDRLVDKEVVFRATPKTSPAPLSGGRLLFVSASYFMVTIGDKRDGLSSGQDLSNHFGTVVKILADSGRTANGDSDVDAHLPEIYTFGHRNIQGIALDRKTGAIWVVEHGPAGGDELSILRAGANYGWPAIHSGTDEISPGALDAAVNESFESAIYTWPRAIAPSGLAIYRGTKFSEWSDSIFVGSLIGCHVRRISLDDDGQLLSEENLLGELGERIRDVRVGPDEAIYILTDEINGKLISIEPLQHIAKAQ